MAVKLLLVEDNEFVQRMYDRVFKVAQFDVTTAVDGAAAIQLAKATLPDIIIMDVMMPKLNGLEALKVIKADSTTKNIPVIMLSAHDDESLMMQALSLGANRYLLKSSLEPDMIVNIINGILSTPSNT
jgi:twitching motility two-component system response regulator PilH